jgi:NAD(P)-dependent dehydrogenase (short-subunit alcohol dehydrogenase family)
MSSLAGRVALVTGASSGIGRAIALALAAVGIRVFLAARDPQRLEEVASRIRNAGGEAVPFEVDLLLDRSTTRLAELVRRDRPELDILVHAAGTITTKPLLEARMEDFDRQYRVNVRGPYLLTQRLLPTMVHRRGHIVFINSSAGLRARAGVSQYAATKHALKAVADSLREELRGTGVRVLSLYPGNTATPMQVALHAERGRPFTATRYLEPADLASLIVATLTLDSAEVKDIDLRPLE